MSKAVLGWRRLGKNAKPTSCKCLQVLEEIRGSAKNKFESPRLERRRHRPAPHLLRMGRNIVVTRLKRSDVYQVYHVNSTREVTGGKKGIGIALRTRRAMGWWLAFKATSQLHEHQTTQNIRTPKDGFKSHLFLTYFPSSQNAKKDMRLLSSPQPAP